MRAVREPSVPSMNAFRYPRRRKSSPIRAGRGRAATSVKPVCGDRLPDAEREALALVDPTEDRRGSEPSVLVVDRADSPGVRDADSGARRLDPFVLGDLDEPLAEAPGRLLPEDACRLSIEHPARRRPRASRDRRSPPRDPPCSAKASGSPSTTGQPASCPSPHRAPPRSVDRATPHRASPSPVSSGLVGDARRPGRAPQRPILPARAARHGAREPRWESARASR